MRPIFVLLLISACGTPEAQLTPAATAPSLASLPDDAIQLRERAVLDVAARGEVVPVPGADLAMVGMSNALCSVSWSTAHVGKDYEGDQEDEESPTDFDGARLLATSWHGYTVFEPGVGTTDEVYQTRLVDARFTDLGVVTIANHDDQCEIRWPGAQVAFDGWCPEHDAIAVDAAAGTVWLAAGEHLITATPAGLWRVPLHADLLAFDATRGLRLAASIGEGTITALNADDSVAWETEVPGSVWQVRALGTGELAAVASDASSSAMLWIRPADGALSVGLRSSKDLFRISASADGARIALGRPYSTALFDVERY